MRGGGLAWPGLAWQARRAVSEAAVPCRPEQLVWSDLAEFERGWQLLQGGSAWRGTADDDEHARWQWRCRLPALAEGAQAGGQRAWAGHEQRPCAWPAGRCGARGAVSAGGQSTPPGRHGAEGGRRGCHALRPAASSCAS